MMFNKKIQKIFFWLVISTGLLLSLSQVSLTSSQPNSSDLIISEFLAANGTGLTDEDGDYSDWIEIYNRGPAAINLAGWALTDDPSQPQKWPFPDMNLGSHEYLVVFASGKNRPTLQPGAALHTNFKLSKTGDFLALHNVLEGEFMDMLTPQFPEQLRDISYGRYGAELVYGYLARPTPGSPNDDSLAWTTVVTPIEFSAQAGFYDAPFLVELVTATPGATIRYTTDGSEPSETNGTIYNGPIQISTTTLLRAAAFKPNLLPAAVNTQSYIFLNDVLDQPAALPGLPVSWGARLAAAPNSLQVLPISADYEMDPQVVHDPQYQDTIKADLQSLPLLSLVMTPQDFANLYSHPDESGQAWERPVSVELIYPDGQKQGWHINAGIRLHEDGAASLKPVPKYSFRLLFKAEYGATELEYPLFPDSPVEAFDTLVLQAGSPAEPTTYVRDEWLRASQGAMAGLSAHGLFVQLYLNGLYWGLYNLVERPDASFMSIYLGGEQEDWFVADLVSPPGDVSDGETDRLNHLLTTLNSGGFVGEDPEMPADLTQKYTVASYLDPVQFSDYVILNWYAAALGWPENNGHVAIRRQDLAGQGKYLLWNEPEGRAEPGPSVNFGPTQRLQLSSVNMLLETRLQNPDFRMQFADRMYQHLFNDGTLTDANAQARWLELNRLIEPAIAGESARWGDAAPELPLTPEIWRQGRDEVLARMTGQAARLVAQAREAGYYPRLDPPQFSHAGGLVEAGFTLHMTLPARGTIYYTTDGSDPRLPVTGAVAPNVVAYEAPLALTTNTRVKARVLSGDPTSAAGVWSALQEATFNVVQQDARLRITEIMYNPAEGDDYEFIELKNMGNGELNLANLSITEGIYFTFPANSPPLRPGEFAVLVSNSTAFAERYPDMVIGGVYDGHLSNKGEKIILSDTVGQTLLELEYNDENGWPVSPDGRGDSLVLIDEAGDLNDPKSWRASIKLNGAPGTDEPGTTANRQEK